MSLICGCTPEALISIPSGLCLSEMRRDTPAGFAFYNCNTEIPTGSFEAVGAAMFALWEAGEIVFSPKQANVVFEDPTYDEIQMSDCNAPQQLIATRAVTFEDRTKIDVRSVSPFTNDEYYDYTFWEFINRNQVNLRAMIYYCSGDVKDIAAPWTVRTFINYIKSTQAGGKSTETKMSRMMFQGDPIPLNSKPIFNYIAAGITL